MKTAILASEDRWQAWQRRTGDNNVFARVQNSQSAAEYDVFIDLNFDEHPENIQNYSGNRHTLFLLSSVCFTPEMALFQAGLQYKQELFFGINAIPGFLERNILEITNPFNLNTDNFKNHPNLPFDGYEWVKSRIGMVTPRIVFMIINEAYYTVQEGTADEADIDTAMKLGTAYPHGPFEWLKIAGINNVYKTLLALWTDTGEERYKICPLLKSAYMQSNI